MSGQSSISPSVIRAVQAAAIPLSELRRSNFSALIEAIGDARLVLIGEATHGTAEFYSTRAELSRLLLSQRGFDFVAVEGDWPDCYRVNRFIQHRPPPLASGPEQDRTAEEALSDFTRFPQWMWRNVVVRDYAVWCRQFNAALSPPSSSSPPARLPVAFYGLDLYSLFTSADAVIAFLERVDSRAAERARERYATLGSFRHEPQEYGVAVSLGLVESQQAECARVLVELLKRGPEYIKQKGFLEGDELFYTQLNALLVKVTHSQHSSSSSSVHTVFVCSVVPSD